MPEVRLEDLDIQKYRHMRASDWREVDLETLYVLARHKGLKGNGSAVAHKAQELILRRNGGVHYKKHNLTNTHHSWVEPWNHSSENEWDCEWDDEWDDEEDLE